MSALLWNLVEFGKFHTKRGRDSQVRVRRVADRSLFPCDRSHKRGPSGQDSSSRAVLSDWWSSWQAIVSGPVMPHRSRQNIPQSRPLSKRKSLRAWCRAGGRSWHPCRRCIATHALQSHRRKLGNLYKASSLLKLQKPVGRLTRTAPRLPPRSVGGEAGTTL